jgi:hypothetical protein
MTRQVRLFPIALPFPNSRRKHQDLIHTLSTLPLPLTLILLHLSTILPSSNTAASDIASVEQGRAALDQWTTTRRERFPVLREGNFPVGDEFFWGVMFDGGEVAGIVPSDPFW